jgi:hypothetical protein
MSRSEAIRNALLAWVNPPIQLSEEILENLKTSRKQREHGETHSLDEVADKYGGESDQWRIWRRRRKPTSTYSLEPEPRLERLLPDRASATADATTQSNGPHTLLVALTPSTTGGSSRV